LERKASKQVKIRFLGTHNCESMKTRLVSILIDGVLALDAGALTSSLSFTAQQRLRAIMLTHQHYDHIRDIPTIAMNLYLNKADINVYSTREVYDALASHLFGNHIYRNFLELPEGNPTIKFTAIEPGKSLQVDSYRILPVAVDHPVPTVGLQVASADDKILFYTSDTGPGLRLCWQQLSSPRLLIIEVTAPNRYEDFARESKHLTPSLLKGELEVFRAIKGYLPQVVLVHMNPRQEKEIAAEAVEVASALDCSIVLAQEGMEIGL